MPLINSFYLGRPGGIVYPEFDEGPLAFFAAEKAGKKELKQRLNPWRKQKQEAILEKKFCEKKNSARSSEKSMAKRKIEFNLRKKVRRKEK